MHSKLMKKTLHFFQKSWKQHNSPLPKSVTQLTGLQKEELAGFSGSLRLHRIDLEFLNQNTHHRLTKTELFKT